MVTLHAWDDIKDSYTGEGSALLIGNGASVAVWNGFAYGSLLDVAKNAGAIDPISTTLFAQEGSADFEAVLRRLQTARDVAQAFGSPTDALDAVYLDVQSALRNAVVGTHVPWLDAEVHMAQVRTALLDYRQVYSSNYDLLVYWALMLDGNPGSPLKDLFWSLDHGFDELNAEVQNAIPVYWIHGGVHLETLASGEVRKRIHGGANLLDSFGANPVSGAVPLMITEGSGEEKRAAIAQSPYLSHVYRAFASNRTSLAIVGHGLNPASDSHLRTAIQKSSPERIAVSIYQPSEGAVDELGGVMSGLFPHGGVQIDVFDAGSHPLCAF